MATENPPEQQLLLADEFDRGYMTGYRVGELERIALANANSDLRSDLLKTGQELRELQRLVDR